MTVRHVCGDPTAIDAEWMTQALQESGVAQGATVTALRLGGFIGTGQTGCNARFHLEWDRPEDRPVSVVGKFPSRDEAAAATAFANLSYLNEWDFYNNVVHTLEVRTPVCHVSRFDHERPDFVLIMEDLAGCRQGDQIDGLTVDEAALAVEQAIGMHAPRWGDPTLAEMATHRPKGPERAEMLGMYYDATLAPFLDRLGAGLDDDVIQLVRDFQPFVSRWAQGTGTPHTVVHMDYRPDNFMFGVTPEAPPLAIVDFQTVTEGIAMMDLAYLLGGCFQPAYRAEVERGLLAEYHARLTKAGVDYDEDTLWRDYRFASLWGVAMTVIATIFAAETERGNAMLTAMGQRHGRHALDLDALDLLR